MAITFNHNDQVYVKDGKMGIGASDPLRDLHVVGNFAVNAGTDEYYGVYIPGNAEGSDPKIQIGDWHNASATITWDSSARALNIDTQYSSGAGTFNITGNDGASTFLTVNTSGNVGIGTTSPSEALHIYRNAASAEIRLQNNTISSYIRSNTDNLNFYVSNGEKMRITSAGNVGIGTTSPIGALTVQGDDADIYLRSNDYTIARIINRGSSGTNLDTGLFSLMISDGTNNNVEAVRLDAGGNSWLNGGNVGIGTSSPGAKLDVVGNIRSYSAANNYGQIQNGSFLAVGNHGGTFMLDLDNNGTADLVNIKKSGTSRFYIENGGNVGIGTTSPGTKLHINESTANTPVELRVESASWNSTISLKNSNGTWSILNDYTGLGTTASLAFYNTGYRMVIDSTGNVGIGTTSPSYKLHVQGTSYFFDQSIFGDKVGIGTTSPSSMLEIRKATATHQLVSLNRPDSDVAAMYLGNDSSSPANGVIASNYSDLILGRDQSGTLTEHVRIKRDGNVGIGTTSPNSKLEVNGAVTFANIDTFGQLVVKASSGTTGDMLNIGVDTANSVAFIQAVERGQDTIPLSLQRYGGNVGIGTTSPSYKLHVASGSESQLLVENTSSSGSAKIVFKADSTRNAGPFIKSVARGGSAGDSDLRLGDENGDTIIINGGNVGIGTTSPAEKLDVNGNIKLSGIQFVEISNNASITPSAGDWIDIAELNYGEHHGRIALEWNSLYAPSSSHHGWAEFNVGTYYSANYNYGQDTYVELTKALAHNDFWLDAVRAVDYGSTVRIQVKASVAVTQGTFKSYVLEKSQGTVNAVVPAVNNNSYTVLALANIGKIDGEEVQKAFGNHVRFSSDVAFDEKVGIGTTSPALGLHVANGLGALFGPSGSGASTYISADDENTINGGYGLDTDTADLWVNYRGYQNGTSRFRDFRVGNGKTGVVAFFDGSSGNVGIGTTSPAAKLTVKGADGINAFKVTDSGDGDGFKVTSHTTQGTYIQAYDASHTQTIILDARTDSASRHTYFNGGGNVGIGTTSPAEKLDVNGDVALKGTAVFNFDSPTLTIGDIAGTDSVNALKLTTADDSTTVYLDDGGNVGIGTTSPSTNLDVVDAIPIITLRSNNDSYASLSYYSNSVQKGLITYNAANNTLQLSHKETGTTSNDAHLVIKEGNVGIGTTSPGAKLDVSGGSLKVQSGDTFGYDSSHAAIYMDALGRGLSGKFGGNGYARNLIKSDGSATVHIGDNTSLISRILLDAGSSGVAGYISLQTKQAERVRIDADGNVGIGTTSPSSILELSSTAPPVLTLTHDGTNPSTNELLSSIDFDVDYNGGHQNWGKIELKTNASSVRTDMRFYVKSTSGNLQEALLLQGGSANPKAFFTNTVDINGDLAVKGASVINRASSVLTIGDIAGTDSVTNLTLTTAGRNTELFLDDAGNVGINDTTPSYALDVTGTIRATGDVIAYSDARVKENVETIPNALDKVKAMRGVGYNKIGSEERSIGVIAQEMLDVMPEVVHTDDQGMHSVAYGNLVGVLIEAMKEQQAQIDELKAIIANR